MATEDKNPPTKALGQVDQTAADDFVPRQNSAVRNGASPAEVVGAKTAPPPVGEQKVMARSSTPGEPLKVSERPTKTIVTNVTVHTPTEDHVPYKMEANGVVQAGHYSTYEHPPGSPVTLDAKEADRLIARFGGQEVPEDYKPATEIKPILNDSGPVGETAANRP
jgi:hypothetical protein